MSTSRLLTIAAAWAGMAAPACAAPALAPLFQDHAILQRDIPVPVWGLAAPREHVVVSFAGQKVGATAGPDGRWIAVLAPLAANPIGADLTVQGKEVVAIHDVLVGEVWLFAGGSGIEAAAPRDAAARYPLIRFFRLEHEAAAAPADEVPGAWKACAPEEMPEFTALGYFFSREIYSRLGVPVAVISASWPGSPIEAWMSAAALAPLPRAAAGGTTPHPPQDPRHPSSLFNGMIHPLLPYALRGVIWCQGEGDVGRSADYAVRFPALIKAWRSHLGEGDIPFFWVLPAGPASPSGDPGGLWPRLGEAQSRALQLPATGQAVAIGLGDSGTSEVARRLALVAKATVYSIPVDYAGPQFGSASVEGAAIRVRFQSAGEGLTASDKPLQSFEVAGSDHVFHPASASIQGDSVVVRSAAVKQPIAVRYAWRNPRDANLFDGAGLPAAPFRSDDW
jgi:sialate O-acetylesterase